MNAPDLDPGYRFYPPKFNRFWSTVFRPIHLLSMKRRYQIRSIAIEGESCIQRTVAAGHGVLVTPNHSFHGDALALYEALYGLGVGSHFMAAWQVFSGAMGLKAWALQRMGIFSVDREGNDLKAFRQAVDILAQASRPLVIFPEGEVYHLNDRITPLREGAAMIALSAARRRQGAAAKGNDAPAAPPSVAPLSETNGSSGKVVCVPCAIKAFHLEDPTPSLEADMDELERRIYWRPQRGRPLEQRIYKYAAALLSLKEREYTEETRQGPLRERIAALIEFILSDLEEAHFGRTESGTVPIRVKGLRRHCLELLDPESPPQSDSPEEALLGRLARDVEDIHFVTQLFSYPGDYVAERPTIERMAETVQKFREDALGVVTAVSSHPLRAVVKFGEPIDVSNFGTEATTESGDAPSRRAGRTKARDLAPRLTQLIEDRIQNLLDELLGTAGSLAS